MPWVDASGHFGWVWKTDLTFYSDLLGEETVDGYSSSWSEEADSDPGYQLLTVKGYPAVGHEGKGVPGDPRAALAWTDGVHIMQLIAFTQTLDEVIHLAGGVSTG